MASSSAPVHPARYLSVFLVMLIGIYLLVFFTGDKHTAPKLGIDLQGGTRVTLTRALMICCACASASRLGAEPSGVRAGQRAGSVRVGGGRRR